MAGNQDGNAILGKFTLSKAGLRYLKKTFAEIKSYKPKHSTFLRITPGALGVIAAMETPGQGFITYVQMDHSTDDTFMTNFKFNRSGMVKIDRESWLRLLTELSQFYDVKFIIRETEVLVKVRHSVRHAIREAPISLGLDRVIVTVEQGAVQAP